MATLQSNLHYKAIANNFKKYTHNSSYAIVGPVISELTTQVSGRVEFT